MTKRQVFFKVVLLQVVKRVTPSVGNEIITLVKDTSLSRIISVTEILFVADNYTGRASCGRCSPPPYSS